MQKADKIAVLQAFVMSSHYYGRPVSDEVAAMYQYDVRDLPAADVVQAIDLLRREPKRRTCPLPAEVRAFLSKGADASGPEQIAARIVGALSRFGYNNSAKARAYIGETGWAAVEEMGSWPSVCARVTSDEVTAFTAQARELCRAHLERPATWKPAAAALQEGTKKRLEDLVSGIG